MRTRIKFCGMTRREDALAAAEHGADAIGLIFAPRSVRRIDVPRALAVCAGLPPFVARVALFMDQGREEVAGVLAALGTGRLSIDLIQFHGSEDDAFCASFGRPFLKALPMAGVDDADAAMARFPSAAGFVLDAHAPGAPGGGGVAFDWSRVPSRPARPLVLAGGLTPANVHEAIARTRPYAVDVASGIEASPGAKDRAKMIAFANEVRRADAR
jgi:phosphoribosylanthranilate isomerase